MIRVTGSRLRYEESGELTDTSYMVLDVIADSTLPRLPFTRF